MKASAPAATDLFLASEASPPGRLFSCGAPSGRMSAMCPEDFEPFDLAEIYARKEPLLPELAARLEDMGGFIALRHPLLYTVPFR